MTIIKKLDINNDTWAFKIIRLAVLARCVIQARLPSGEVHGGVQWLMGYVHIGPS
jgi:hypothetical protein